VFETLADALLDPASDAMSLYDWGNANCCLPKTQFSAALVGDFEQLKSGDYLIFDGSTQRDVVRLTAEPQIVQVTSTSSPPTSVTVTLITWGENTPLNNDYCINSTTVRGNVIPATHGETVFETLRLLSEQDRAVVNAEIAARPAGARIPRQRLTLQHAPLAHLSASTIALGQPLAAATSAAIASTSFTSRPPLNISTLQLTVDGEPWQERTSLLESGPNDTVFRVEMDDLGEATVVFGDGVFGLRPAETSTVIANYRVGGGSMGNVGADSLVLARPTGPAPWLKSVTNPLPATGGRDWESLDHARRVAPASFHQPVVAVSAADYQEAAEAFVDSSGNNVIQRANANFLWTGSWLTVTLTVDPLGTEGLTADLKQQLTDYLNTKRLAGYDIQISGPTYVPVDLALQVSVTAGSQQSDVEQALLLAFSSGTLPDGTKGFFHPDNFTFGDNLFASKIYATAMAVPGVQSVTITELARSHSGQPAQETTLNLAQGFLLAGTDEVIRLDNDRNFPENGTLTVTTSGAQA
jgi:predicted phage baseplate assembly protein